MIVRESISFERGLDPKEAMKIGNLDLHKLKSFYRFVEKNDHFQMGDFKYPNFEFFSPTGLKIIISKNPENNEDFIYHSYNKNDQALGIDHFTNLEEFKKVLNSRFPIYY
jgi:hypothetical protein